MGRTLLVTNDFPPTIGGIQSYLRDFLRTLNPEDVVVFASTQDQAAARDHDRGLPFRVHRWPHRIMLPTPATAEAMANIIVAEKIDTVWFGAAAPLALMARRARKAGASRIVATTHGHEVGWSMLPFARQVLRRIGDASDVVTYISDYTLGRFRSAFGPHPEFRHLPSGVDTGVFIPAGAEERAVTRHAEGWGKAPVITCISRLVPRKGQDQLIRAMPAVLKEHPEALLVIVGDGPYRRALEKLAAPVGRAVRFTGKVDHDRMVSLLAASDIFAMPARTRGGGLDVEGLGIVYLEAQSCGLPVIAGDSGGAPETVVPDCGVVVSGRDGAGLVAALSRLLADPELRARWGSRGRRHVEECWTWEIMGARLRQILAG
ncbi:glycosyltransferase family 4 protein [Corynebacterium halotolerans]|uniref:glycosyltransferase family 4 protein n=1 Tax=Corynebacterium halotolerans TaxID=225326 RepID=UPI003CF19BD2